MVCASKGNTPTTQTTHRFNLMADFSTDQKKESDSSGIGSTLAWGTATGANAAIATEILDGALVALKNTSYGKYYDAVRIGLESGIGIVTNEFLEVSKDGENFGWGQGTGDFISDLLVTTGGNVAAYYLVGAIGLAGAPAAIAGLGIASVAGAGIDWVINGNLNWVSSLFNEHDLFGEFYVEGDESDSPNYQPTRQPEGQDTSKTTPDPNNETAPPNPDEDANEEGIVVEVNGEAQPGDMGWVFSRDVKEEKNEDGSTTTTWVEELYDGKERTGRYRVVSETYNKDSVKTNATTSEEFKDTDNDGDGMPTSMDKDDSDPNVQSPNPMNYNGNTDYYNGEHNETLGGDSIINYGQDGRPADNNGFEGEINESDPITNFGQDNHSEIGNATVHEGLMDFDPATDWGQDTYSTEDFTGNQLTDRLGSISPIYANDPSNKGSYGFSDAMMIDASNIF